MLWFAATGAACKRTLGTGANGRGSQPEVQGYQYIIGLNNW